MHRFVSKLALCLTLGLATACSSTLTAEAVPNAEVGTDQSFYVARLEKDERGVNQKIADEFGRWGRRATTGEAADMPATTDVLVTYSDRWQWDMNMYMLSLEMQLRDAQTEAVLASGKSLRTSLIRKDTDWHVRTLIKEIFSEAAPEEEPPGDPEAD